MEAEVQKNCAYAERESELRATIAELQAKLQTLENQSSSVSSSNNADESELNELREELAAKDDEV